MSLITTNSSKGQEILGYLREQLGIPAHAVSVSVHFETGDVIRVDCSYLPTEKPDTSEATE